MRGEILGSIRSARAALLLALALLGGCSSSTQPATAVDSRDYSSEPALSTPQAQLDQALDCEGFTHPDQPAILLVHGTFTNGAEQYEWTYKPLLQARGYDVCTITYPDRGFGDMQVSAEYVVHALRVMHAASGRKVAVIGHSQGVSVPRWAIKWWPSAREAVDDFVMEAGPNHGIAGYLQGLTRLQAGLGLGAVLRLPEVFFQFASDSQFMSASNAGDETPGSIDYTALYSLNDELVQPARPVPTAAVDFGQNNPHVSNILLQDVCPGRLVDHVTIGLNDALAFALALDAIEHPGPAQPERVLAAAGGQAALCGLLPLVPDLIIPPVPDLLRGLLTAIAQEPANGLPGLHLSAAEPPLRDYAR